MRLIKPSWMINNDKPIFSIDIHPDNSRCVTAVQGAAMGIGEIIVWNMGPIRDEHLEKDPNVPSILCRMDNHNACVNCVRWSPDGRYLASASDDKLVIVWHCLRGGDGGSFGSKDIEAWKVASTLRGHSGDVLDLSWSANLQWLASCSVDNTIIIWNVANLPEQVMTLKRHTSMVKGVSFDPTASYLASQSDDQSVRIWRTYDWKETKCITEPFKNSSGNSHLLRLDWSPDGDSLVATNAVNNTFPVAQIIERLNWNTRLDMVGHRKPTTCVRYNSRLFVPFKGKKPKNSFGYRPQHAICGVGSKDRSLSIWSTNLGRPVVVIHDLFKSSLLDISWAHSGIEMLCCSWDGTVAYVSFDEEEIGTPISQKEKEAVLEKMYGKTALNYRGKSGREPIICETVEQLSLLEGEDEFAGLSDSQRHKRISQQLQAQHSKDVQALYEKKHPQHPTKPPNEGAVAADSSSQDVSNSSKSPNKQIETRTKDGKRKIMPIFLSHQPSVGGEAPLPFTTSSEPSFSSSKESSTIVVEKQQQHNTQQQQPPNSLGQQSFEVGSALLPGVLTAPSATNVPAKATPPASLHDDIQTFLNRKRDNRGGIKVDSSLNNTTSNRLEAINFEVIPQQAQDTISASVPSSSLVPRLFSIPALKPIKDNRSLMVCKSQSEGSLSIECRNSHSLVSRGQSINRLSGVRNGETVWQSLLSLPIVTFTANSQFVAAITSDHTLHMFRSISGRSIYPPVQMDSPPSLLKINSSYLMLVTSRGALFVWDLVKPVCLIRNESLEALFSVKSENLRIFQAMITDQGVPIISLSNGRSYSYNRDFQNWVLVSSVADLVSILSDFNPPTADHTALFQGSVLHNISKRKRGSEQPWDAMACDSSVHLMATLSHLESKVNASIALKLPEDFQLWTMNYIRYLVKFNIELRLRDVLQELINPYLRGDKETEDMEVLGVNKEQLLRNILKIIRENRKLESLYKEFHSQFESIFAS